MKTFECVVIFSLIFNFAYTSSINSAFNDVTVEDTAETEDKPPVPNDEESLVLDTFDLGVEVWAAHQCSAGKCDAHCLGLGHARGVCTDRFCQCRLRSSPLVEFKKDNKKEIESRAEARCTIATATACIQICTLLGYRYFRCANGRCTCWN